VAALTAGVLAFTAGGLALGPGCASDPSREVEVGHHRLRLIPPETWEHLDHGRQQLFRNGEVALALEDWGPVTPEGLQVELQRAQQLWLAGRRRDAFARVRELHGPPVQLLPSRSRADFWKPWTDVTYVPEAADSVSIGVAFQALIAGAGELDEVAPEQLTEHVLSRSHDADRREIANTQQRSIHGRDWVVVETWDRVSHLYRRRVAWVEDRGYLLVLDTERGLIEQTGPAFERLLASIEVLPGE
jgi:hypothetical protein